MARILVVDDDCLARSYEQTILEGSGFAVVSASDSFEALRIVQSDSFDLFVIDVMMPQMNGTELSRHLRRANPDAKVLYVTGFPDRLLATKSTLWDNEAFIEKPISPEGLVQAVRLMLDGTINTPPAGA